MLAENLAISAAMIIGCVLSHSLGIYGLMGALRSDRGNRWRNGQAHHQAAAVVFTVFGLLLLHALQIAAYAWLYQALGQFNDAETAVYFSSTTFTTLGDGDVQLAPDRRIIAGIEGVIGLILIGWSTAVLVSLTGRVGGQGGDQPPQGQDLP